MPLMFAEFIERVDSLKVSNSGDLSSVVVSAKYHITCTYRGERLTNMFDVVLSAPDPTAFVSFERLTEDQVLSWVKSAMGEDDLNARKSAMATMIDQIIAGREDVPQELAPPWQNVAALETNA
jgi:hypothetical protein